MASDRSMDRIDPKTGKKVAKSYKSAQERFLSDEPWGTSLIKVDSIDWEKLEKWAKENLRCIVCEGKVAMGDRAKMHMQPAEEGMEVRIAHFHCLGREADGVTPYKPKLLVPVRKAVGR